MFKDRDKFYQAYHAVLSMALTWALILAINQYYVLRIHILVCALFSLMPSILIYLFDYNRKNTISYLILFSIFPVAGLVFWIRKTNPVSWLDRIIKWCVEYDGTEALYVSSHAHFTLLGAAILASVLLYLLIKRQAAKFILAAIIFALLVLLSVFHIDINKFVVGISIFYLLSILVELTGKLYSIRTGQAEKKAGILYLAPLCMLLALLSVALPSKPEPIKWQGVKNIYFRVKDTIDRWMMEWEFFRGTGSGEFAISLTGYSEDGRLDNDDLVSSNKIALEINGRRGRSPIYLIGSVRDQYTGYSWEKSGQDFLPGEKEYYLDYLEVYYALSRQEKEKLENSWFVDRRLIEIIYDHIKTKTFFYPNKSSWYRIYSDTSEPGIESANIMFPKAVGEDTRYENIYYEMNLQGQEFQNMLREADSFSYSEDVTLDREMLQFVEEKILRYDNADSFLENPDILKLLRERAGIIKEKYTVLPETLPDRVKELALEITGEEATAYDKLKAIEEYLLEYTYSFEPGKNPEGSDFVDFFLFENKKGYCTSFASAMAVLGRCVGIPTRYVEGFTVDYNDKAERGFYVRNNRGHSWAEAYFEGVGWIPFEATPPYNERRYTQWTPKQSSQPGALPEPVNPYENMIPPDTSELSASNFEKKNDRLYGTVIGIVITILTAVVIVLLLGIYYSVLRYRYRKTFEKADYSTKMYMLFLRILKLLEYEGFTMDPRETVLMLNDRVRDLFSYNDIAFLTVAKIFMRYRYAEAFITEKEFDKVTKFYHGLSDKHGEETGKLKLHLEEFRFLMKKNNR